MVLEEVIVKRNSHGYHTAEDFVAITEPRLLTAKKVSCPIYKLSSKSPSFTLAVSIIANVLKQLMNTIYGRAKGTWVLKNN